MPVAANSLTQTDPAYVLNYSQHVLRTKCDQSKRLCTPEGAKVVCNCTARLHDMQEDALLARTFDKVRIQAGVEFWLICGTRDISPQTLHSNR